MEYDSSLILCENRLGRTASVSLKFPGLAETYSLSCARSSQNIDYLPKVPMNPLLGFLLSLIKTLEYSVWVLLHRCSFSSLLHCWGCPELSVGRENQQFSVKNPFTCMVSPYLAEKPGLEAVFWLHYGLQVSMSSEVSLRQLYLLVDTATPPQSQHTKSQHRPMYICTFPSSWNLCIYQRGHFPF